MLILKIVRNQKSRHRLEHTRMRPHGDAPLRWRSLVAASPRVKAMQVASLLRNVPEGRYYRSLPRSAWDATTPKSRPVGYGVINVGVRTYSTPCDRAVGYGTFSVSISQVQETVHYIGQQLEHYQKPTFPEEYLAFLTGRACSHFATAFS
jgi:hypothetical protein